MEQCFTFELLVGLYGHGPIDFFSSGWNVFDAVILIGQST
jgi:hypothetical protein